MTATLIDGQLDLLELLAPVPAAAADRPPLQPVLRPLTRVHDYAERYPRWLHIGERCPACGHHFDYPQDASNNHHVPYDADPSAPVCTAMYLTRNHLIGAVRRGDPDAIRDCVERAERWWSARIWDWFPQLLEEHGLRVDDFKTPIYFYWKDVR